LKELIARHILRQLKRAFMECLITLSFSDIPKNRMPANPQRERVNKRAKGLVREWGEVREETYPERDNLKGLIMES
jgi:hypothetical protein